MKIVFMGTPEFGAGILNEIVKEFEVVLVVTQPDKEVGRKKLIEYSAVKKEALALNIPVFQPINIRKEYEYIINNFDFDLIVTAAYGQIVGTKLLDYPKFKAINVHGSLLPKYRGGAPIQRAIMNGDKTTGITIMYMAKGMDSGDILVQKEIPILDSDNSDTMFEKLKILGASMINKTIKDLEKGLLKPIPQNESLVTYAYNIDHSEEELDFTIHSSKEIFNIIRGLSSNPGAYFTINDFMIKVYSSSYSNDTSKYPMNTICDVAKDHFSIACKEGIISFYEIKPMGKGLMTVRDFMNGRGKNILILGAKIG